MPLNLSVLCHMFVVFLSRQIKKTCNKLGYGVRVASGTVSVPDSIPARFLMSLAPERLQIGIMQRDTKATIPRKTVFFFVSLFTEMGLAGLC